ncbi:DUF1854 domain-containing protein [Sphaerotilus mobilis]|uniref:Uncharacterized protein DUF1854 n=1 Tax=Sphaerotilus mobilis TaxID=47994 RepID=A0A4Q7LL49_9BURK|nr:DUF1854 domain-containing protein [Sphaerotilus mobilis]RZS54971.1 uncharacterized protein DUF1854 [Sphaerotilus mobilis]
MEHLNDKPAWTLARNPMGRLVWTGADGIEQVGVVPVRAFPLGAPDEGLSLVSPDGHELVWIDSLDAVAEPARALIAEELALREFVPEIVRLVGVSTFSTPSTWTVETDRGATTFVLKAEEDIRRLTGSALLIASAHGIAFRIHDRFGLDRASRRLLERFL